ncbi:MAG: extracellular solute-binding protein [Pseudomonadales bacterium]|nr:extracellular solute-binding protein [Pseudomonadales bacterium]
MSTVKNTFLYLLLASVTSNTFAEITHSHGIALYGDLKYPANFTHFDYVNPAAPKGGDIRLMSTGSFDTLNPYTLKGISPANTPGIYHFGISELNETLLVGSGGYGKSGDEPQSAYGLIAESVEYPDDRSWVIFNINPKARFHNGDPITAEDVLFSFNTLMKQGHPRFQNQYKDVSKVEKLADLRVKFSFNATDNRSMPLRAGELPILSKRYWQDRDFTKNGMDAPLGSGPYRVAEVDPGRMIRFERVKNYWGNDLPVNRGRFNFDTVAYDFYRDLTVAFQAFKAHEYDAHYEYISSNWKSGYDFPARQSGEVKQLEIRHQIPANMQAFFFNTRRELFKDVRVRQAIGLMFDFEWLNRSLFADAYTRTQSYFDNTDLASTGTPKGAELALLEPYRDQLPAKLFTEPFKLSKTKGDGNLRQQQRAALKLLAEAGWKIQNGKLIHQKTAQPFSFTLLSDQPSFAKVLLPFKKNLERIGINMVIRTVDRSHYKRQLDGFDFDMTVFVLVQSSSPAHEMREYFHSSHADINGNRNYAGIKNPVVDALVDQLIASSNRTQLVERARALDRVLLWNHYVIPQYHINYHRLAIWDRFGIPKTVPDYRLGFENWWIKPTSTTLPEQ